MFEKVLGLRNRLDILVNNAGITRDTLLPVMSDEDWDAVIATNLQCVFALPSRLASHDAGPVWPDHQHLERLGNYW